MANGGQIKFGIGFNVDKAGLNQLKAEIQQIKNLTANDLIKINDGKLINADKELKNIQKSASQLEGALKRAFNTNLGTLNVSKFNQELKKLNLNKIYSDFSKAGTAGQNAFRNITAQVLTTNMQLKKTHSLVDSMAKTMGNTIKWGVASSVMNSFTGSVRKAYTYVKDLDTSLNNIRIVTEKSSEEMDRFAKKANETAKALGQSTTAYTDASLIYYQQGLGDKEVEARAETTLKAANVTGQTGEEVSEQLTAVWNGYKVSAEETELYVDKLAAVAATTASDLEELSTGMEKVASAASSMGVDIDQLNGHLATVISVTRQAPESVGTAFKTIYARLGDLAVDGEDEFGTKLGEVSGKLKTMGIEIIDTQGQMRDMGTVMEEVAAKWDTWTDAQKQAAAVAMAGKRQYNNLIALFDNWDMYEKAVNTSANAMGTLQEQQDIYMESTAAHLKTLKASSQDLYDSLMNSDGLNDIIDGLIKAVDFTGDFVDAIGGGGAALMSLGVIATRVFSKQIAGSLATTITNLIATRENLQKLNAQQEILNTYKNVDINDPRTQNLITMKEQILNLDKAITNEERNAANEQINQTNELYKERDALEQSLVKARELRVQLTGDSGDVNTVTGRKEILAALEAESREVKELKDNITELANARAKYAASQGKDAKARENYTTALKHQIDSAKELIKNDRLDAESKEKLVAAIERYNAAAKKSKNIDNTRTKEAALAVQEAYKNAIEKTNRELTNGIAALKNYDKAVENNKAKIDNAKVSWQSWINQIDLRNKIQQFTTFIGKVGQLAMGLNTLSNLGSIWNNDDLTTGQKTLQIVTNLTFAIPMLITGFSALGPAISKVVTLFGFLTTGLNKQVMVEQKSLANKMLYQRLLRKEAQARGVDRIAIDAETKAKLRKQAVSSAEVILSKKQIHTLQKEVLLTKIKTSETWKLITAEKTLMGVTAPLWKLIAGGIAIFAGVALAIHLAVKAQHANEDALRAASEAAERQGKILTELQEKHKALQDQIEGYEEVYNKVINMTEGMEGYAEAVDEANQKAKDLIETLGLYGDWSYGENGLIQLDEEAVQKAYDEADKKVKKAQIQNSIAQYQVSKAEWNLLRDDIDLSEMYTPIRANKKDFSTTERKSKYEVIDLLAEISMDDLFDIQSYLNTDFESLEEMKTAWNDLTSKLTEDSNLTADEVETLSSAIKGLGDEAEETVGKIISNKEEEDYYAQEIARGQAAAQGLFSGNEAAITAYGNLIAQDKKFQNDLDNTIRIELDRMSIADWLSDSDKDKYGSRINDEELSRLWLKYVEKLSDEEIDRATYKKGTGQGTIIYQDGDEKKEINLKDDIFMQDLQQALTAEKYASKENISVNQEEVVKLIDAVIAMKSKEEDGAGVITKYADSTQEAILTALSNYKGGNLDLDLSLVHPDDLVALKKEASDLGFELGDKIAEALPGNTKERDEAVKSYYERAVEAQDQNIDSQIMAEGLDSSAIETQTELIQENIEALEDNDNAAKQLAVNNTLMNQGMENLIDNWEDWSKVLKSGNKTTSEYAKTVKAVSSAIEDLVGLSEGMGEKLSSSFFDSAENLALLERAANADAAAVEELGFSVAKDLVKNINTEDVDFIDLGEAFEDLKDNIEGFRGIDLGEEMVYGAEAMEQKFESVKQILLEKINQIQNASLGIGDSLGNALGEEDIAAFVGSLNAMAIATHMTVSEMQGLLNSMGMQATVTTTKVPTMQAVPIMKTVENIESEDPLIKTTKTWQVDTEYYAGYMDVAQVSYNGDPGAAPITKIGHGAPTQSNVTKATPSSSGGGSKPKKSYKTTEKEKDPYHNVNNKLKKYSTEFERLADAQDRLYGKDLKNNLNEQLKIIKKQISATKEKLKIAKQEAEEMRKSTKNQRKGYYNDLKDFGIKFNKNGEITNYDKVLETWDEKVKNLHDKWNKMTAKQQESDAGKTLEKQIEKAETNRDMLVQLIEDYDTLIYDTIPGLQDEITEFAYQQMEIRLAKFNLEAEIKLDLSEAIEQWEDFKRNIIELKLYDDLGVSNSLEAEARKLLKLQKVIENSVEESVDTKLIKTLKSKLDTLLKEQEKIDKNPKSYKGQFASRDKDGKIIKDKNGNVVIDEKALKEAIDQKKEELQDAIINLRELEKEALENVLQGIDLIDQSYDKEVELLEHIENQAQHELDMIKLINGEGAYDKMAGSYAQMAESAEKVAEARKREMDYYREQMNKTDITEEEREKFRELYLQSAEDYQAALQHHAEILKEEFSNYVQSEIQTLKDYLGFDKNKAIWELEMEISDDYLDEVESAFGTQSFINKVQESINNTDSPAMQKKLNDLLDKELAKLREKDKLTQYDLDRANAMYELELKKIALEEAQQNKSKMRLRRDASGNYSYQFVADESVENKAQEELLKAQNDLYKLDKEEVKKNYEELLKVSDEYFNLLVEWNSLSLDEQEARREEFTRKFAYYEDRQAELASITNQTQVNMAESAFMSMQGLYAADEKAFSDMSAEKIAIFSNENLRFEDLAADQQAIIQNEVLPSWTRATDELINKISDPEYLDRVNEAAERISERYNKLNEELVAIGTETVTVNIQAAESADRFATEQKVVTAAIKDTIDALRVQRDEIEKTIKTLDKLINKYESAEDKRQGFEKESNTTTGRANVTIGVVTGVSGKVANAAIKLAKQAVSQFEINKRLEELGFRTVVNQSVAQYDTGGYTGSWGSNGKLAVLHEKELVLNKEDTSKLLDTIEVIRAINANSNENLILSLLASIKENAGSSININYEGLDKVNSFKNNYEGLLQTHVDNSILKINNYIERIMEQSAESIKQLFNKTMDINKEPQIEQKVEIYADFPNADDTQEIKDALLGLTNAASQYVLKR